MQQVVSELDSILKFSSMSNIYMKNDYASHNADKDGDKKLIVHVAKLMTMLTLMLN